MSRWAVLAAMLVVLAPAPGAPVRRLPDGRLGVRRGRRSASWAVDPWWGATAVVAVAGFAVAWWFPALAVAGSTCARWARRRLAAQRVQAARVAALPEVLELVAMAIRAGGTVPAAIVLVAERGPPAAAGAFSELLATMAAGSSFLDAVEVVPRTLGEPYRPLCSALLSAERDGAPLVSVVAQLAHDAHESRRRAAEARARQVPVRLLLPLVCGTLPALLVVTIVPLVVVGGGLPG